MTSLDPIPQARVVRSAGQLVAPPRAPRAPGPSAGDQLRSALAMAIGLWPLTGVVLLAFSLLVFAGLYSSP